MKEFVIGIFDDDEELVLKIEIEVKKILGDFKFQAFGFNCLKFTCEKMLLASEEKFDLLLFGIEKPGVNELNIYRQLKEGMHAPLIICLISCPDLMDDIFELKMDWCLIKPINKNKLKRAVLSQIKKLITVREVVVNIFGKPTFLKINEIIYIEKVKDRNETIVYLVSSSYKTKMTLKEWLKILPSHMFIQIHRSRIANLKHVISINHRNREAHMTGSLYLKIARELKSDVQAARMNFKDISNWR